MTARSLTISLLALLAAAALGEGGNPDPIVGEYSGTWSMTEKRWTDGEPDPSNPEHSEEAFSILFLEEHTAHVESITGTWKKKNGRYSVDLTKSATEMVILDSGDPNATETFRCKKVRLLAPGSIHGKVKVVAKYRLDGARHKNTFEGPFDALETT